MASARSSTPSTGCSRSDERPGRRNTIAKLNLVDARSFDPDLGVEAAEGSVIAWEPDAAEHDFGTVIEPDGRIVSDASGAIEPRYL